MTPEQFAKLIDDGIKNGITSASWRLIIFSILAAFVGAWVGGYLKKKSEHYATKEDFDELLRQVIETTKATEAIRLEMGEKLASFTEQRRATFATELETIRATLQLGSGKELSSFTENLRGSIATQLETVRTKLQEDLYYRTEVLLPRLEAYKLLWELTYVVRPTRKDAITQQEKENLRTELTRWYYEKGYGICLSLEAGILWRDARNSLVDQSDDKVKDKFSALRTQLKKDIKVYGELEANFELGR
jgi:hypothetical protein